MAVPMIVSGMVTMIILAIDSIMDCFLYRTAESYYGGVPLEAYDIVVVAMLCIFPLALAGNFMLIMKVIIHQCLYGRF